MSDIKIYIPDSVVIETAEQWDAMMERTDYPDPIENLMPLKEALNIITDDFISNGYHCDKTVMDLRDACKQLLERATQID